MLPFLPKIYTDEVIGSIAGAFTAVEVKRGWDVQKFMSEEFVLAVVAIPPTLQAIILTRQHLAAIRKENEPINAAIHAEDKQVSTDGNS